MSSTVTPEWIKKIKDAEELAKAQSDAERQRQLVASLVIGKHGPLFWKQLLKELQITVEALPQIGVRGLLSITGDINSEACCQVHITREGLIPSLTYMNLFYSKRNLAVVRCHPMQGQSFTLSFVVHGENTVFLVADGAYAPMDAEQTAQFITEGMVRLVRPQSA